ncbi:hypothetical protein HPB48_007112 [Haemaphysalis longicornis]|uniref:Uncharacterized protein n=1 Tax=Haemaphysalis longicornis TaxID=44386 RepID=A0A9J6GTL2_HAELO|nr:hypothetical protein HPB48_007112 [Haemaphysalis longicornis]
MASSAMASTEPLSKQRDDTQDEDNMQCGSNEEEPIESYPDEGWILNVSRAQRRKAKVSDTKNQKLTPARPIVRPSIHNAKPKPPPLPKDDYKLVIRPKEGLALAKLSPAQLSEALLQEAKLTWREADLRIRVDETQNILTQLKVDGSYPDNYHIEELLVYIQIQIWEKEEQLPSTTRE